MMEGILGSTHWVIFAISLIAALALIVLYLRRRFQIFHLIRMAVNLKNICFNKESRIPPLCLLFQHLCSLCVIYNGNEIPTYPHFGSSFLAILCKPETVEVVMRNSTLIDKGELYRFLRPYLGRGLLTSNGNTWRSHRKFITPAFHFKTLEGFIPVFDEHSSMLVSKLHQLVKEPWVDILPIVNSCSLDIFCQTALGIGKDVQEGGVKEYSNAIHEMGCAFMYRVSRPWLWNDRFYYSLPAGKKAIDITAKARSLTMKVIQDKKLAMKSRRSSKEDENLKDSSSHEKTRKTFLEMLLEKQEVDQSFTEKNIREEVDTFMAAGHASTALCISWTLYLLGLHPDVQEQVQKEVDDIFVDDETRCVVPGDIRQMKYMSCVIKETLRLYPVAPLFGRKITEDIQVLDSKIPAGSTCLIFPYILHRDPEQFPNPEIFDPDRFLLENSLTRHPFSYLPFAAGPRNCIGQKFAIAQVKTVLANILRQFRVVSLDQRDKIILYSDVTLCSLGPLRVKFLPRR